MKNVFLNLTGLSCNVCVPTKYFIIFDSNQNRHSLIIFILKPLIRQASTFILEKYIFLISLIFPGHHLSKWRRATGAAGLPPRPTLSYRKQDQQHGVSPSLQTPLSSPRGVGHVSIFKSSIFGLGAMQQHNKTSKTFSHSRAAAPALTHNMCLQVAAKHLSFSGFDEESNLENAMLEF